MNRSGASAIIARHRLPLVIVAVIVITLIMTAISMSLYISSGAASLDLSRPGYAPVRDQVQSQPTTNFDENGPMNQTVLDDFRKLFDSERTALNSLPPFQDVSLDDASLKLGE